VESGEWRVESGEWRVESGEWRVERDGDGGRMSEGDVSEQGEAGTAYVLLCCNESEM
jgi:hypothetical protein